MKKENLTINKMEADEYANILAELQMELKEIDSTVETKILIITPELALSMINSNVSDEYIDDGVEIRNDNNRRRYNGTVSSYVNQMKNNKWKFNGESIILSEEFIDKETNKKYRIIMNGQHRLVSCIKSGHPFISLVVSGVPYSSMPTIDTGKVRNTADAVMIEHIFKNFGIEISSSCEKKAAGIAKKKLEYDASRFACHGSSSSRTAPSNDDAVEEITKHPHLYARIAQKSANWVNTNYTNGIKITKDAILYGSWAAYLIISKGWNEDKVFSFFDVLVGIKNSTDDGCPMLALRKSLQKHFDKESKIKYTPMEISSFFSRAWAAYVDGKQLTQLNKANSKDVDIESQESWEARMKRKTKLKIVEHQKESSSSNELEYALAAQ